MAREARHTALDLINQPQRAELSKLLDQTRASLATALQRVDAVKARLSLCESAVLSDGLCVAPSLAQRDHEQRAQLLASALARGSAT